MNHRPTGTHRHLIIGYLSSILLVLFYLNMFPVVKYIVRHWGTTPVLVLPLLITAIALAVIFSFFMKARKVKQDHLRIIPIILGIAICLVALAVPDPEAPVKRIHVIEYMLLSLLIRYTMSVRLQGFELLTFSVFFASLLGVHDELLQGLHPLRTYGIRDILVNALGSAGGGLIWHGFKLFEKKAEAYDKIASSPGLICFYLAWLFCSVIAFFIPLYYFREKLLPLWPAFPLIVSLILFIATNSKLLSPFSHGIRAVSYASFTLLTYLIVARLFHISFF